MRLALSCGRSVGRRISRAPIRILSACGRCCSHYRGECLSFAGARRSWSSAEPAHQRGDTQGNGYRDKDSHRLARYPTGSGCIRREDIR